MQRNYHFGVSTLFFLFIKINTTKTIDNIAENELNGEL